MACRAAAADSFVPPVLAARPRATPTRILDEAQAGSPNNAVVAATDVGLHLRGSLAVAAHAPAHTLQVGMNAETAAVVDLVWPAGAAAGAAPEVSVATVDLLERGERGSEAAVVRDLVALHTNKVGARCRAHLTTESVILLLAK
jgi:hypothetical protein